LAAPLFFGVYVDLNLVRLIFEVETNNSDVAAFYQALRRFEQLFRQACCGNPRDACIACKEKYSCSYRAVFAQDLSSDPDVVRRHQKPPLPFAFKLNQVPNNGSYLEISLVVAGKAINHLDVFFRAVRQMLETIPAQNHGNVPCIRVVYCLDYQMLRHELDFSSFASRNVIVLSSLDIMENPVGGENIRLDIESPLRLLCGGSELRRFDFSSFLRSQMRRCSSLFAYYGDGELDIDFAGLSGEASLVKCLDDGIRYSQPSWSPRPNHAGLLGASRFAGVTPGILSLLTLGAYINAGKLASYGFGAYGTEAG